VLAGAGRHEQAEAVARSLTDPYQQAEALTRVAGALAGAGQYEQAEAVARSLTHPRRQAEALTRVAEALAETGNAHSACRVAAAACMVGQWTTSARLVLMLDPSAFAALARVLDNRWHMQLSR
jgi:hypothetical protein